MAMLFSLTPPKPSTTLFHHHHNHLNHHHLRRRLRLLRPISATQIPSSPPPPSNEVYQPFRPPSSPLPPQYRSLGPAERLDILRDRLGLWHEYAPLIPSLSNDGFTPPSIEEATGISGVEQNCLVVAARVRDSLISSNLPPDLLSYFDFTGGADLLYELRLLNAVQRVAAAHLAVELRLEPKAAQELARAVRDFPRRRGDDGWDCFSASSPGDCLAFTYFRLSREAISADERAAALERAMEAAKTEEAKRRITVEMEKGSAGGGLAGEEESVRVDVPVVRLQYGEVAEATKVVVLPVVEAGERLVEAPKWCKAEGEFGVVRAEKGWRRWVVLPGWGPVAGVGAGGGGVVVEFRDARAFPWRRNRWEKEEAVLVVVERGRREVVEERGFYLVGGEGGGLEVERGGKLWEKGVKEAFGTVVLVVRPPRDDVEDQLPDEDWV